MYKKIVLAGGTGHLGGVLAAYYKDKAEEIVVLSRKRLPRQNNVTYNVWDGKTAGSWASVLEGCDLLINLCGKNVNCRYTPANQKEILRSRTEPTELLGNVIKLLKNPPRVWINITSATIYRHAEDQPQDEENGEPGTGFSVDVCKAWEETFSKAHTPHTTKIILRTGIVFGRKNGVYPRLRNLAMAGLGGHQGHGGQYISWIHELDFARITDWLFTHGKDNGIYNGTAPEAIKNKELMRAIRSTLGIPIGLATPQWLLKIGAKIIGTETELVLKSRWVYPKHLTDAGFLFQFPRFEFALHEI